MLALLASFLTSVLIINICPIPANFAPEARIHNFVAWDKEVWSRAGNSIWSFSARNFPQLHLRPANADLATTTAEKPDCPVRKPEASSFVLEQGLGRGQPNFFIPSKRREKETYSQYK